MFYKKTLFFFTLFVSIGVMMGVLLPFIFLKDIYPFHRFGMFAEPIKHQTQYEKFYIFYKIDTGIDTDATDFVELKPQNIPLNANAFEMQLRKHHYQKKHADFISVFNEIIKKKINLDTKKKEEKLKWKWYHVIQKQGLHNETDSICVFSN